MKSLSLTFSGSLRLLGAAALLTLAAGGCSHQPTRPLRRATDVAPTARTPEDAVRLIGWCWEHRSLADYRAIFTDDYRFAFSVSDSCASAFPEGLTRDDELAAARRIFVTGTFEAPPLERVRVGFDPNLVAVPDSRPGKMDPWHREVACLVQLSSDADPYAFRISTMLRFFLVRGDSAKVPEELREQASKSDTTRWYVERWEEEDPPVRGTRNLSRPAPDTILPTRALSWGYIKCLYLQGHSALPVARERSDRLPRTRHGADLDLRPLAPLESGSERYRSAGP